ncbi:hypothetical protein H2199_002514 [Coniosporium tulheliwenetii]|uniref:Uncharacterized protein n=1 Tax=Coniosporium tulheliwenetii TaxID=3383036 RepID=A0ACC2ZFA4_9PEZI|nr:hypothetical protein H2199_002514 [Cladosporium sp. JES 115]
MTTAAANRSTDLQSKPPSQPPNCPGSPFPPCSAYDFNSLVRIKVGGGDNPKEFRAHRGVLTHSSSYFKAALSGHFKEGKDGEIDLPDDDPNVFEAFYYWLFTRQLWDPNTIAIAKAGSVPLTFDLLCKIFVFGDARGIPGLRNAAVDAILYKSGEQWIIMPTAIINYVYENTPKDSMLRKLAVDMVMKIFDAKKLSPECNPELLMDLVVAHQDSGKAYKRLSQAEWRKTNKCDNHDHAPAAPYSPSPPRSQTFARRTCPALLQVSMETPQRA